MISHLRDKRALELIKLILEDYGDYVKKYVNGVEVDSLKIRGGLDEIHVEYEEKKWCLSDYPNKLLAVSYKLKDDYGVKFNYIKYDSCYAMLILSVYDESCEFSEDDIASSLNISSKYVHEFYIDNTGEWIYVIDLEGVEDEM